MSSGDDGLEAPARPRAAGRPTLKLARIGGTTIEVHASLLILMLAFTWFAAAVLLPDQEQEQAYSTLEYWVLGAASSLLLFLSVAAHELAHVAAARLRGLKVDRVVLFFHSSHAPQQDEARSPGEDLLLASVGPLATGVLAAGALLLAMGLPDLRHVTPLLRFTATTNAVLLLAHLVPGLPLDGGRMVRALAWAASGSKHRGSLWAGRIGMVTAGLLALTCVIGMAVSGFGAGWLLGIVLSLTLALQCAGAARLARLREGLSGLSVRDLMEQAPRALPRITSVSDALAAAPAAVREGAWLVEFSGRLGGIVTLDLLRTVPEDERDQTPVGQVAVRLERRHLLDERLAAEPALARVLGAGLPLLPVVREGALIGILRRDALLGAIAGRRTGAVS